MKKFLNNPWVVTVGGAIVFAALSAAYDFAKKQKVFTTLWKMVTAVFRWIVGIGAHCGGCRNTASDCATQGS